MDTVNLNGKKTKVNRIFCVAMNYSGHIKELKSKTPDSPVIFMKPLSSLVTQADSGENRIPFPAHGKNLHYEAELVLLISKEGRPCEDDFSEYIAGYSIGLDLTLRDVQNELKKNGYPWESAKAFDGAAAIGQFTKTNEDQTWDSIHFTCKLNDQVKQSGNISDMIFPVKTLLVHIGGIWKLQPGDLIYTGTLPGVGSLKPGDSLSLQSEGTGVSTWSIVASVS